MSESRTVTGIVADALAEALAVVLPVRCAGCDRDDQVLCAACRRELEPHPRERTLSDGTTVRSALAFAQVPARVIRALKEEGRTGLARPLGAALAVAAEPFEHELVVPVPTSRAAMRRRGYRVGELLARRARLRPVRALRQVRVTADQRGLGQQARAGNVAGSMRARGVAGRRVLIVDDVLTSGATVIEAARALDAAGAQVVGAATVAFTPRRHAGATPA